MIPQEPLLVILVKLIDRIPEPPPPAKRKRGKPRFYPDRLFLKALVIMIVRHLHKVHELLTVLDEPTAEMQALRALMTEKGRYPTRRTWERRLKALPASLPAQIACLGRHLVALIQPWATCVAGPVPLTALPYRRMAVCGIRRTRSRALCPIPPLTRRLVGPNQAGTGGSMVGNCMW